VRWNEMSRVHLGMKRPIRQFDKYYKKMLELVDEIEKYPPTSELEKTLYILRLKNDFNDCLIQLNNIKNTQIEYLEKEVE
jgi:hypothetical protein